jgi:hypothetical protein
MKNSKLYFLFSIFDFQFKKLKIVNGKSKILVSSWFILSLAVASTGCLRHGMSAPPGQHYYTSTSKNLQTIRTVCLVELHNNSAYPQISGDVTESLHQALQKKHLFGLSLLRQSDVVWRNLQIHPDSAYTLEQLLATRKMLGVDAVLIGAVTSYTPYPHMAMGLQLKLVDLRDGQLAWAIEQVWDTADKNTEEQIKKYFERELRQGFSPLGEQLAMLSSINFVRFVTYNVAETLN